MSNLWLEIRLSSLSSSDFNFAVIFLTLFSEKPQKSCSIRLVSCKNISAFVPCRRDWKHPVADSCARKPLFQKTLDMVISPEWRAPRPDSRRSKIELIDGGSDTHVRSPDIRGFVVRVSCGHSDGRPNGSCDRGSRGTVRHNELHDIACGYLRVTIALLSYISLVHYSAILNVI